MNRVLELFRLFFLAVLATMCTAGSALLVATGGLCLLALPAAAQSYTVLYPFRAALQNPSGLVQATSDGSFYGTTNRGGGNGLGSVFKITPTGTLTTLYSFSGSDGANPQAGLIQGTDGSFYGTTYQGGTTGNGSVFKITPAGALTTLHSFSGSDGANPQAGLVQGTDGSFYGTSNRGGANSSGTVFKITPAGTLTTIYSFWWSGGTHPSYAGLVQGADGNFYGTIVPSSGSGSIFKITPAGTLTILYDFDYADGYLPYAGLAQGTDGSFYGTTEAGGANGYGTVFKVTPAGTLTTLHSFAGNDGRYPYAGLVQGTDGNFYGTTYHGGSSGDGTVFKITPAGVLTTLHTFLSGDGQYPYASVVQGTDGNFYGTTSEGGASGNGAIFRINPDGTSMRLYSFAGSDGQYPYAGLVQGTDGSFYGTTYQGGTNGNGSIFKITPAGALIPLHSFVYSEGKYPYAGLVLGTDGSFYGTATEGGSGNNGTVFKITPAGALTTLHSFVYSDGRTPYAGLVQGTDGSFYGTTYYGGTGGYGTCFTITPAGALTTLHSFVLYSDGVFPYAGLVQGTDGDFYGTTSSGAFAGSGAVFKITPAGAFTIVQGFGGFSLNAGYPYAGLVQGTDGTFYGTTKLRGNFGNGAIFKITPTGTLTTLYSFAGSDGASPYAGLVQGTDGNFYGTTFGGGTSGTGTIFKITPTGSLTTLHSFAGNDGANPYATLVQGTDGYFYGTTSSGGALGGGVVFRVTPGVGPSPTVTNVSPASGPLSGGTIVTVSGTDFQPGATVMFGSSAATGVTFVSATTIYALTPSHAAGAVTATVTNPDLQAGSLSSAYTYICASAVASGSAAICPGQSTQLSGSGGVSCSWSPPTGLSDASSCAPTASPSATTTYTLAVTDGSGCVSTNAPTVTVTVNAVPATPTASSNSPLCAGGTLQLNASTITGAAYLWTGPNGFTSTQQLPTIPTVTTAAAGTYSVTVTIGGCTSPAGTTAVVVNPTPATPVITAPASTVAGTTGLTASMELYPGSSCAWAITNGSITSGQGTNQITFTAGNSAGPLTLTAVVTTGGCQSAAAAATVAVAALPGTSVVTGVVPRVGPVSGGTPVTLTGTGFQAGATIAIGGAAAGSVFFVSPTTLTATTPSRPVGPADVTVTNPGGAASTVLPGGFLYTTLGGTPRVYAIVPCRILDTRNPSGPFGGPPLAAGSLRTFAIPTGSCPIPADAAGVVLNVTIADATAPGTLTIYPGSGAIPGTNTISFVPGKNRANNVVLGLVGGVMTVKNYQSTGTVNLIVDVNGYFQ